MLTKEQTARKNEGILRKLLEDPSNNRCADCGQKGSSNWASWNLGIFLCIKCCGFHRHLGTHISKTKGVLLDNWTDEQIESMLEGGGNERSNRKWNALNIPPPTFVRGTNLREYQQELESYIRDKYQGKKFMGYSGEADSSDNASNGFVNSGSIGISIDKLNAGTTTTTTTMTTPAKSKPLPFTSSKASGLGVIRYMAQMSSLSDMGFMDGNKNQKALLKTKGNVQDAVEILLHEASTPPPSPPSLKDPIKVVVDLLGDFELLNKDDDNNLNSDDFLDDRQRKKISYSVEKQMSTPPISATYSSNDLASIFGLTKKAEEVNGSVSVADCDVDSLHSCAVGGVANAVTVCNNNKGIDSGSSKGIGRGSGNDIGSGSGNDIGIGNVNENVKGIDDLLVDIDDEHPLDEEDEDDDDFDDFKEFTNDTIRNENSITNQLNDTFSNTFSDDFKNNFHDPVVGDNFDHADLDNSNNKFISILDDDDPWGDRKAMTPSPSRDYIAPLPTTLTSEPTTATATNINHLQFDDIDPFKGFTRGD